MRASRGGNQRRQNLGSRLRIQANCWCAMSGLRCDWQFDVYCERPVVERHEIQSAGGSFGCYGFVRSSFDLGECRFKPVVCVLQETGSGQVVLDCGGVGLCQLGVFDSCRVGI